MMTMVERAIANEIYKYFKEQNIKKNVIDDFVEVLSAYYHHIKKWIHPHKRQVVISKELQLKINENQIDNKYIIAIEKFKDKFEDGLNMNGHLSKQIYNSKFYDKLLICWRIHHLHLDITEAHNKREMTKNRSNMLLFCIIVYDRVYFIDIESHKKDYVFSMFNLLDIIYNNWISLIENYELKGVEEVYPVIKEDKDIYELREANINIVYELKGKYYSFLGLNTAGTSIEDTIKIMKLRRNIIERLPKPPLFMTNVEFNINRNNLLEGNLSWNEGECRKTLGVMFQQNF